MIRNVKKNVPENIKIGSIRTNFINNIKLKDIKIIDTTSPYPSTIKNASLEFNLFQIIKNRNVVSSIKEINIADAKIAIVRKKDGKWNFEYLVKKDTKKGKLNFQGKVNVKKCDIKFIDEYPTKESILHNFKDVNFIIDFSFSPFVLFKIKDKNTIYLDGKYNTENEEFDIFIDAKSQKLTQWENYIPKHNSFKIMDGIFNANVYLTKNKDNIIFFGNGNLQDGEIFLKHFKKSCNKIFAELQFTNKDIVITSLKFNLGEGNADGAGIVSLSEKPKIYFKCNAKNISTLNFGKYSGGISSLINSKFIVRGDITSPSVEGEILLDKIAFQDFYIQNIQSKIKYYNNNLLLSNFQGNMFGERIQGDGFLRITQNTGIFNVKVGGLNLDNLINFFKEEKVVKKLSPPKVYISVASEKIIYKDLNFEEGYVVMEYTNGAVEIKTSLLSNKEEKIFLSGSASSDNIDALVNIHNIKMSKFDMYLEDDYKIDGLLYGEGNISGSYTHPKLNYEFTIVSPEVNFIKNDYLVEFDEINGNITLSDELLEINKLTFEKDKTFFLADGAVELNKEKKINLQVKSPYFNVEDITRKDIEKVDASFWGSVVLEGTIDDISSSGILFVNEANVFGETIKGGKINFTKTKDIFEIQPSYVDLGGSLLHISGPIDMKNKIINVDIVGNNINVKDMNFLDKHYSKTSGTLTCYGKIEGSFDKPQIILSAEGKNIKLDEGKIDAINLQLKGDKNFVSTTHKIYINKGEITTEGNLQRKEDMFSFSGVSNFEDVEIENIFSIFKFISPADIKGKIKGKIDIVSDITNKDKIKFENTKGKIEISSKDITISKNVIDEVNLLSYVENDKIYIRTMEATRGDSMIMADGNISFSGDSNLLIEGSMIDTALFKDILPSLNIFEGIVNFSTRIKGDMKNPDIAINIEGINIAILGHRIDVAMGNFSMQDDIIKINRFELEKNNQRLYVEGILPFSLKDKKMLSGKNMSVDIFTQGVNLGILRDFTNEINFAYGDVSSRIELRGTKEKPILSGEIIISGGEIDFFAMRDTIKDIQVRIYLKDDKIILEKINGKIKGGNFDMSGNLHIKDFNIDKWNISLLSKDTFLDIPPTFSGVVGCSLKYLKEENMPVLYGDITIKNSKYVLKPPTTEEGMLNVSPFSNTLYNLEVKVEDDVWVRNNNLRAEVKGNLYFKGKITEPTISGKLTSVKGSVSYLDTIFNIEEASIYFPKLYTFEPSIQARASTQIKFSDEMGTYIVPVMLNLDGDASQTKIDIEYDDKEYFLKTGGKQLTKKDIISHLAYKHTINELLKGDVTDIIQKSARGIFEKSLRLEILDPLEKAVGKALGLTDFGIEYGTERDYKLRLGKLIERNFYVSYSRSFAKNETEKFKVEHRFLRSSFLFYEIEKLKSVSLYRIGLLLKYQI